MVKRVTSGFPSGTNDSYVIHASTSHVRPSKGPDSYTPPASTGFSFAHGMSRGQFLRLTNKQELRFTQNMSVRDLLAEFEEIYAKAQKVTYQKHGLEFTYALVSKTDVPYLAHIGSMGFYAGNDMLFVVSDMMPNLKPEDKARAIEYVAVHEYGESIFGDHHEASLLEFAIAEKEDHLDWYLQILQKNYFLKFRDVALNRMGPVLQDGFENMGVEVEADEPETNQSSDLTSSADSAKKLRDKFVWKENYRKYLADIGSYQDAEVEKTQNWASVIIVNEEVKHHLEAAISLVNVALSGSGSDISAEAIKIFYSSFSSLNSLFEHEVYDKKLIVYDSLNKLFGDELKKIGFLAVKEDNPVKSVLDAVERINKIAAQYLQLLDDSSQGYEENPQVLQKAFELATQKFTGIKITVQDARRQMLKAVNLAREETLPRDIEDYLADEFKNYREIQNLLNDNILTNLPPELFEKVFLYQYEALLYYEVLLYSEQMDGDKSFSKAFLDVNPMIAEKIFQRVLDQTLSEAKRNLQRNKVDSHPLFSIANIKFDISKMQERYGTFISPKNKIIIEFVMDELANYLNLHEDSPVKAVVIQFVNETYLAKHNVHNAKVFKNISSFIHDTHFSEEFKEECLKSFISSMGSKTAIHPFLLEVIFSELGIEGKADVLQTVALLNFGYLLQEPMLVAAIREDPKPLLEPGNNITNDLITLNADGKLPSGVKATLHLFELSDLAQIFDDNAWVPAQVNGNYNAELIEKIGRLAHDIKLDHVIESSPDELEYLDPQRPRETSGAFAFFVLNRLLFLTYKLPETASRLDPRDILHFKKMEEALVESFKRKNVTISDKKNLINWDDALSWCREHSKNLPQYLSALISELVAQGSLSPMSDYYFTSSFNAKDAAWQVVKNVQDILVEASETERQSPVYDEMVNSRYSLSSNKKRALQETALEGHADSNRQLLKHYLGFIEFYKSVDINPLDLIRRYSQFLDEIKPLTGVLIQSSEDAKLLMHGLIQISQKDRFHIFQEVNPWHAEIAHMMQGLRDVALAIPQKFVASLSEKSRTGIRSLNGNEIVSEWNLKSFYDYFLNMAVSYSKKNVPPDILIYFEREGIGGVMRADFDAYFTGAPFNAEQVRSFLFNLLVRKTEDEKAQYILEQCFDPISKITDEHILKAGLKILTAALGTLRNFQPQSTYTALGKYTLDGVYALFGLSHDSAAGFDSFNVFAKNLVGELPQLDQMQKGGFLQGLLKAAQKPKSKKSEKALELSFAEYQQKRKDVGARHAVPVQSSPADIMPEDAIVGNSEEIVPAALSDNGGKTSQDTAFEGAGTAGRAATFMTTGSIQSLAGIPILPVR